MKLEEGMFVRTKMGKIAQLQEIQNEDNRIFYWFDERVLNDDMPEDEFAYYEQEEYLKEIKKQIIKASHNIIDLIEVGDYVNGDKVIYTNDGYVEVGEENDNIGFTSDKFIKSIVTKEKFESMSYKI